MPEELRAPLQRLLREIRTSVIAKPSSRRRMRMPMNNRNLPFPKAALITVLLLVSALSGQGQSDESRPGQWRIRRTESSNSLEPTG